VIWSRSAPSRCRTIERLTGAAAAGTILKSTSDAARERRAAAEDKRAATRAMRHSSLGTISNAWTLKIQAQISENYAAAPSAVAKAAIRMASRLVREIARQCSSTKWPQRTLPKFCERLLSVPGAAT
jgi:type II secretory pathway pseudopilin PulG